MKTKTKTKTKNNTQEEMKVSTERIRKFSDKHIEHLLGFFNRIMNNCVYMVDYRTSRILFGSAPHPTICGYSRASVKR
ncbi:MAG: hypothetical protein LBP96_02410, partial [Bacteroidales bacterium]|nr:hypothetical protein [Bacteroidales bacterium]